MNRFLEKLKNAVRGEQGRLGFGGGGAKRRNPGIGLVADLGRNAGLADRAGAIADAVLVDPAGQADTSFGSKTVWGAFLAAGAGAAGSGQNPDAIVINADSDAAVLQLDGVARLYQVEASAPDASLEAIGSLSVDGLLVTPPLTGQITIGNLLSFLRVGALTRKPVLLRVGRDFPQDGLVSLREAGISGVVVSTDSADDIAVLQTFRDTIDQFPKPPSRERNRDAIVPAPAAPVAESHDHDDDDDE